MAQYLLSVFQPDGDVPPPEVLDPIVAKLESLNRDMREAGVWVFSAGLCPPSTATVLKLQAGDVLMTDGPFVEGKEHLGGFTVLDVPDLDAALDWARRLAEAITLPIEVRPFKSGYGAE